MPDDPPAVPSAIALVEVFATPEQARVAYETSLRRFARTRKVSVAGVRETISLRSETRLLPDGADAALVVSQVVQIAPRRLSETLRAIVLLEGRAQLLVTYTPGRTTDFAATAVRLVARMRPARG